MSRKESNHRNNTRSRPRYDVLEKDRQQRRRERDQLNHRDTAPLARTGKPKRKPKQQQQLSLAESITRDTVEEMLASRRTATSSSNYRVPRPTSKVVSFQVKNEVDSTTTANTRAYTPTPTAHTTATRCEVRQLPTPTPSVGCVLLRISGVSSAEELTRLVNRATTLPRPGLLGLLLDCRLDHVPNLVAYESKEEENYSHNATTPSKPFSSSSSSFSSNSVMLSICSSMEDVRKLFHAYRKRVPKVQVIVGGQVLTFHAVERMGYGEGRARGVTLPNLPLTLLSGSDTTTEGSSTSTASTTSTTAQATLGTAFYRASKEHQADDTEDDLQHKRHKRTVGWMEEDSATATTMHTAALLDTEQEYAQLSPIERALRVLGDDVLLVKQEFDQRSMDGSTVTAPQARRIISCLLNGVVPNVAETVANYRGEFQKGEAMSFSELLILYADKFYFETLKRRHNTMKEGVDALRSTTATMGGRGGGTTATVVSIDIENVIDEYDDDEEWETIINATVENERHTARRSGRDGNTFDQVDDAVQSSIQTEGQEFANRVNAAFRRFDVYGVDLDAMGAEGNYDDDDNAADRGFIMLDDAPDALLAVGLPIEREEAEHLVEDLASGASTDFRGFNLTEFRMVCARVLSIFEDDDEGDDDGRNTSRSQSNRK